MSGTGIDAASHAYADVDAGGASGADAGGAPKAQAEGATPCRTGRGGTEITHAKTE